jgi:hypothetical protein
MRKQFRDDKIGQHPLREERHHDKECKVATKIEALPLDPVDLRQS